MAEPDQAAERSYANEAVRGSIWTTVQVGISKAGAAAATFFLGFLLQPSDFGVAWFAISAGGLATGLHVLAALDVLIASPRGFRRIAGAVQLMALMTAAAELILVSALAVVLSRIYPDRSGLLALMLIVAVRPLTDAMNVLPMARMRLGLEYPRLAALDGITTLTGSLGAIAMAYAGFGAMSIVLPPIASTALRGILYWWHMGPFIHGWSAGRRWRAVAVRFLTATFGSYVSGVLLILDTTILGIFVAPSSLGLFAFASGIATQVNGIISFQIAGSLHPIFAHLRNDPDRQVEGLLRACRLIACILIPILAVQAAVAGPLFRAVWGTRWDDAVPIFMVISVGQTLIVCLWPASFTLKAQGRFRGYLKLQLLQTAIAVVSSSLAAAYGGPIAAAAMSAFGRTCAPEAAAPLAVAMNAAVLQACFGPLTLWLACKRTGIGPWPVVDTIARPWLAALPCAIAAGWIAREAERADIARLGLAAVLVAASAAMITLGVAGAISLRSSTRHDAKGLLWRLGIKLRRTNGGPVHIV
jgi:O-antigen/teichoic acid export membrane protein